MISCRRDYLSHNKLDQLSSIWRVPIEGLCNQLQSEAWDDGLSTILSESRLYLISKELDLLLPIEAQWNFWLRPSAVNDTPPICRVGWELPSGHLRVILEEIRALVEKADRHVDRNSNPMNALRLFKRLVAHKEINWHSASVETTYTSCSLVDS